MTHSLDRHGSLRSPRHPYRAELAVAIPAYGELRAPRYIENLRVVGYVHVVVGLLSLLCGPLALGALCAASGLVAGALLQRPVCSRRWYASLICLVRPLTVIALLAIGAAIEAPLGVAAVVGLSTAMLDLSTLRLATLSA